MAVGITLAVALMVISLFLFHSMISFQNLTTCMTSLIVGEYKSWNRISYLKDFPKRMGSPFSRGWKENLRLYCRFSVPKLTNWEYTT